MDRSPSILRSFTTVIPDIIGRDEKYVPIHLDEKFPDFLLKNKKYFLDWLVDV